MRVLKNQGGYSGLGMLLDEENKKCIQNFSGEPFGRLRRRWEDYIKSFLRKMRIMKYMRKVMSKI
jgi:hypothetical protein